MVHHKSILWLVALLLMITSVFATTTIDTLTIGNSNPRYAGVTPVILDKGGRLGFSAGITLADAAQDKCYGYISTNTGITVYKLQYYQKATSTGVLGAGARDSYQWDSFPVVGGSLSGFFDEGDADLKIGSTYELHIICSDINASSNADESQLFTVETPEDKTTDAVYAGGYGISQMWLWVGGVIVITLVLLLIFWIYAAVKN